MIKIELEIRHDKGLPDISCPVWICDLCKKKIEHIDEGMYHWHQDNSGRPLDQPILIYHKSPCSDIAEAQGLKDGRELFAWMELDHLLGYLLNNSGGDWARLIDQMCPDGALDEVQRVVTKRMKEREQD